MHRTAARNHRLDMTFQLKPSPGMAGVMLRDRNAQAIKSLAAKKAS